MLGYCLPLLDGFTFYKRQTRQNTHISIIKRLLGIYVNSFDFDMHQDWCNNIYAKIKINVEIDSFWKLLIYILLYGKQFLILIIWHFYNKFVKQIAAVWCLCRSNSSFYSDIISYVQTDVLLQKLLKCCRCLLFYFGNLGGQIRTQVTNFATKTSNNNLLVKGEMAQFSQLRRNQCLTLFALFVTFWACARSPHKSFAK